MIDLAVIPELRTRDRLLHEARKNLGARFEHQGRTPGNKGAIDCAGMIQMPTVAAGFACEDRLDYDRYSAGTAMPEQLAKFADRIPLDQIRRASILTFWRSSSGLEEHAAWFVPSSRILHAWIKGGVCEVELDEFWRKRLVGAWDVRGVS